MSITNAARKKALMSHYAGEEVDDIIDTLVIPAHSLKMLNLIYLFFSRLERTYHMEILDTFNDITLDI